MKLDIVVQIRAAKCPTSLYSNLRAGDCAAPGFFLGYMGLDSYVMLSPEHGTHGRRNADALR